MNTYKLTIAAVVACFQLGLPFFATAMTPTSTHERADKQQGSDQATGLFGGIRQDGTFVFLYSETKGIRFYKVIPGVRASGAGVSYDLATLPVKIPIHIRTRDGRITAVELQGVQR